MSTARPPTILLADDQQDVLHALRLLCKGEGYTSESVSSPAALIEEITTKSYDLVIMDLNYARDTTSGREGLAALQKIQALDETLPVVAMTAWGSVELAVEAMQKGARDFFLKPWENDRVISIIRTQLDLRRALQRNQNLQTENELLQLEKRTPLIGDSPAMRPVLDLIERIGPSDANVLITGENGTGKGVVARALHEISSRARNSFVSVNMGGLSEGVFESELFGHVKGAFTDAKSDRVGRFELASGGTLFLDEIANLTLPQQARLLRVIETGEYERVGSSKTSRTDSRIVSATNSDLSADVEKGIFRRDLLFRLNTIEIHLPPLRERGADIATLAMHYLSDISQKYRKKLGGFSPAALDVLASYPWPGNIRELSHVIERSVLMARENFIQPIDLGLQTNLGTNAAAASLEDLSIDEVEMLLIKKNLARSGGSATRAAEALGLSRSAFYRRLQKYGL